MTYLDDLTAASNLITSAQSNFQLSDQATGPNRAAAIQSSLELTAAILDLRMEDSA